MTDQTDRDGSGSSDTASTSPSSAAFDWLAWLAVAACAVLCLFVIAVLVAAAVTPNGGLLEDHSPPTSSAATGTTGPQDSDSTPTPGDPNPADPTPADPKSDDSEPGAPPETKPPAGEPTQPEPDPPTPPGDGAPGDGAAATAPVPKDTPWAEVVTDKTPPPPFAQVCFDRFAPAYALPRADDLRKWFEPVAGHRGQLVDVSTRLGRCGALRGLMRLKAPWDEDTVLRLAIENYNRLQLHFFHGTVGVTLVFQQSGPDMWAGYQTTRKDAQAAVPLSWVLAATDEDRSRRSEVRYGGLYELRYREHNLLLTRGDIVLVRVPLAGIPEDVFVEGQAAFHGLMLARSQGVPVADPPFPVERETNRPADWDWKRELSPASTVETPAGGALELRGDKAPQQGRISTPLRLTSPCVVDLLIEDATPGTGLFLRRGDGRIYEALRFVDNIATHRTCLMYRGNDDAWQHNLNRPQDRAVASVGRSQWVRVLFGCGIVRWWTGVDGRNWARVDNGFARQPGDIAEIGIQHVAGRADCRIRLAKIVVRRLPGFAGLPQAALARQAPAYPLAENVAQWYAQVGTEKKPADVSQADWLRAAVIRTLAAGPRHELGNGLVELLLDDLVSPPTATGTAADRDDGTLTLEQKLALLNDAALLMDFYPDRNTTLRTVQRYHDLGLAEFRDRGGLPYSTVRRAIMTAPLCSPHSYAVANERAIRAELMSLLFDNRAGEAARFCDRLMYFNQNHRLPLVDWAAAVATRGSVAGALGAMRRRQSKWQHPLVEELNKEAYNTLAELQALLDSDAFDDAAHLISELRPESLEGLSPQSADKQRLVSVAAALRGAVRQHPELGKAIAERLGKLAQLRIRQAIAASDPQAVQLAALQFFGTAAAAEAHLWLGDRALASGWFRRAESEYQRATKTAPITLAQSLTARLRLAAAMQGRDVPGKLQGQVEISGTRIPVAEFESMLADLRGRASGQGSGETETEPMSSQLPSPGKVAIESTSPLDGELGENPASEVVRYIKRNQVDWVSQQIATVVAGDQLLVTNRFQLTAYELKTGQRKWTARPDGRMMRAQDWTLTPMVPLVDHDRVFTRMLYGSGPQLVCVDRNDGAVLWSSQEHQNEFVISDPFRMQGELRVLTMNRLSQQQSRLRWATFDRDTGEVLTQTDLLTLRDVWWNRRYCRLTSLADRVIVALGGVVFCLDASGDVRWLRKQLTLPTDEEPLWNRQFYQPPFAVDGRVLVTQPGFRGVECVEVETGRLVWRRIVPTLRRVLPPRGGLVIIEAEDELIALDASDGARRWSRGVSDRLHGLLADEKRVISVARRAAADKKNHFETVVQWIDAVDGRPLGSAVLPDRIAPDPRVGPLLVANDRLWTFYSGLGPDPKRELLQLRVEGAVEKPPRESVRDVWQPFRNSAAER